MRRGKEGREDDTDEEGWNGEEKGDEETEEERVGFQGGGTRGEGCEG